MDPEDFAGITERLAQNVATRVAQTGETFDAATTAVLTDWASEWPAVAEACIIFARNCAVTA